MKMVVLVILVGVMISGCASAAVPTATPTRVATHTPTIVVMPTATPIAASAAKPDERYDACGVIPVTVYRQGIPKGSVPLVMEKVSNQGKTGEFSGKIFLLDQSRAPLWWVTEGLFVLAGAGEKTFVDCQSGMVKVTVFDDSYSYLILTFTKKEVGSTLHWVYEPSSNVK